MSSLGRHREIPPSSADSEATVVSWVQLQDLNAQSAHNRGLLSASVECGCAWCGRVFPSSLVASWEEEPDGEDTGICPFCGTDALVVGFDGLPLTAALLARLRGEWF